MDYLQKKKKINKKKKKKKKNGLTKFCRMDPK